MTGRRSPLGRPGRAQARRRPRRLGRRGARGRRAALRRRRGLDRRLHPGAAGARRRHGRRGRRRPRTARARGGPRPAGRRAQRHDGPRADRPDDLGGPADLVVADLSFISLTLVMRRPRRPAGSGWRPRRAREAPVRGGSGAPEPPGRRDRAPATADRPAGRRGGRGGSTGCTCTASATSPISGTSGNTEYLLWARSVPSDTMSEDRVRDAVREATTRRRAEDAR